MHAVLRRISSVYSPAAKLNVLHAAFAKMNDVIKECTQGKARLNSMDSLFPVFMAVLARTHIDYLGTEIQFLEDFVDMDSVSGESKILMTTLKAAYCQLIKDYETEYVL